MQGTPEPVDPDADVAPVEEPVPPTQVRHPWRSTLRTIVQGLLAFAVLAPIAAAELGLDPDRLPWLAGFLALCAGFARLMALPQVEEFLRRFLPFLAARPRS